MSPNASHNIDDLEPLLVTLQDTLGIIVADDQRTILVDKLTPLLSDLKIDSLPLLAQSLEANQPDYIKSLVLDVVSKAHSDWSLSQEIRGILKDYVLSQLPVNAKVWIAGCGQGQSAYAVVMEAMEFEHKNDNSKNIRFFASDVTEADIAFAQQGIYQQYQMTGLTEEYKKLFMVANAKTEDFQVKEKLSENIDFSVCNFTDDFSSIGQMDLIICPEMFTYFSNGVKVRIIQQCTDLLKSGGVLLTGYNQILGSATRELERVEHPTGVFYRKQA